MPAPKEIAIDPAQPIDFFIEAEAKASITYKVWLQRNGAWTVIGPESTSDNKSDHWIFHSPTPSGSEFAFWLGVWGEAGKDWRARFTVSQQPPGQGWVTKASWTETGAFSDLGNGFGVDSTEIVKVTLR
ncbi:MAG: hypothetical protein HOP28_15875 [Gemmatimonadales bacterium]|nr:hypothetical protein [Gemmatimonadales bacterium]